MRAWVLCGLCGALVADAERHAAFHDVPEIPLIDPAVPEEAPDA